MITGAFAFFPILREKILIFASRDLGAIALVSVGRSNQKERL